MPAAKFTLSLPAPRRAWSPKRSSPTPSSASPSPKAARSSRAISFPSPSWSQSHPVPRNHFVYLNLLAQLQQGSTDLRKLEKIIAGDASLCFRVLRLANSALQHHPGVITTISEALLMVGEDALRRLITVAITGAIGDQRSSALISMILTRARFCELIAPSLREDPAELYLLGMLSLLDALLQTPFPRILQSIPISNEMKLALAGDPAPPVSPSLSSAASSPATGTRCEEIQHQLGLAEGAIATAYTESLRWASTMTGETSAAQPPKAEPTSRFR